MNIIQWTIKKFKDEGGWIPAAIAGASMLIGGILANRQSAENTSSANAAAAENVAAANNTNLQISLS